jgi:hypothetical protein
VVAERMVMIHCYPKYSVATEKKISVEKNIKAGMC